MNSVIPETATFKDVERIFFDIGCEFARELMESFLQDLDKQIEATRDKKEYRHKGARRTAIKTLMGEVPIERRLYRRTPKSGSVEYVFLLDKELGFDTIGNISPNLAEKIAGQICDVSFRGAAAAVSELTGQSISHQGAWNVVQTVGERQKDAEKQLMNDFNDGYLSGETKVPVLFEESDGVWISIQRRGSKKTGKKAELKAGIIYEGWEKRYMSSKEYQTVNKTAFAGFMDSETFKCLRDSNVAEKYDMGSIKYRILNGDGAGWIKEGHDGIGDIVQLDPFHIKKCIVRNVRDKKAGRYIAEALKEGKCEKAVEKIESLKYECGGEESEVKKLKVLESYIRNNADNVMLYRDRAGITLPEPPEGIEYRTLGTMERDCGIYAQRMKGGRSWSHKGAENLAKIIALKIGQDFRDKISGLVSGKVTERITERFDEEIRNTAETVSGRIKAAVYPLRRGEIPFSACSVTNGRKAIRRMFDLKPFSEMTYR